MNDKKILIVDDDPFFLNSLSQAIYKLFGFKGKVKEVGNGIDAIKEAGSSFYNLCFLDINLPDMNGLDVMKKINDLSPETKVAIMTASYLPDDIKKTIEEDASLFIEKPPDLNQVKSFVNDVCC
jgi:DNA-binding NtrC family response regulator